MLRQEMGDLGRGGASAEDSTSAEGCSHVLDYYRACTLDKKDGSELDMFVVTFMEHIDDGCGKLDDGVFMYAMKPPG